MNKAQLCWRMIVCTKSCRWLWPHKHHWWQLVVSQIPTKSTILVTNAQSCLWLCHQLTLWCCMPNKHHALDDNWLRHPQHKGHSKSLQTSVLVTKPQSCLWLLYPIWPWTKPKCHCQWLPSLIDNLLLHQWTHGHIAFKICSKPQCFFATNVNCKNGATIWSCCDHQLQNLSFSFLLSFLPFFHPSFIHSLNLSSAWQIHLWFHNWPDFHKSSLLNLFFLKRETTHNQVTFNYAVFSVRTGTKWSYSRFW